MRGKTLWKEEQKEVLEKICEAILVSESRSAFEKLLQKRMKSRNAVIRQNAKNAYEKYQQLLQTVEDPNIYNEMTKELEAAARELYGCIRGKSKIILGISKQDRYTYQNYEVIINFTGSDYFAEFTDKEKKKYVNPFAYQYVSREAYEVLRKIASLKAPKSWDDYWNRYRKEWHQLVNQLPDDENVIIEFERLDKTEITDLFTLQCTGCIYLKLWAEAEMSPPRLREFGECQKPFYKYCAIHEYRKKAEMKRKVMHFFENLIEKPVEKLAK